MAKVNYLISMKNVWVLIVPFFSLFGRLENIQNKILRRKIYEKDMYSVTSGDYRSFFESLVCFLQNWKADACKVLHSRRRVVQTLVQAEN